MKHVQLITLAAATLILALGITAAQNQTPPSRDWLLDAPDDTARFQLLQRYLRGFDQPMREVGDRYLGLYDAIERENYDLALYHWDKIKTTIQNGYLKRPARRTNADSIFLDQLRGGVRTAFESRDAKQAWEGFTIARNACVACHEAENVAWMNNQDVFDDTMPQNL